MANMFDDAIIYMFCFLFFKQKTAYDMRISDWSSDVCSSDLKWRPVDEPAGAAQERRQMVRGDRELEQPESECRNQCFRGARHAIAGAGGEIAQAVSAATSALTFA